LRLTEHAPLVSDSIPALLLMHSRARVLIRNKPLNLAVMPYRFRTLSKPSYPPSP
jgi:hypothetical protein